MTYSEETELLQLTRENNAMLKALLRFIRHDDITDFFTNVVANIVGNRLDGGLTYGIRKS